MNTLHSRNAFTLVELLVVIGIIALLVGFLLPVLSSARRQGKGLSCLNNLRQMQVAQHMYANEFDNWLVQAGMGHGGAHSDEEASWFNTLNKYVGQTLVNRCPSDESPHWPGGTPVAGAAPADEEDHDHDHDDHEEEDDAPRFRRTSYGINNYLSREVAPPSAQGRFLKITSIRNASSVVQFLEMAHHGEFAAADHPHINAWSPISPFKSAAEQLAINVHGKPGDKPDWSNHANWGFLDGHAELRTFRGVFESHQRNSFDPDAAK